MTAMMEGTTARRLAAMFRLLGSDHEGEVLAAVAAMKRMLGAEGLSINDISTVLESCNGLIEEKKYSDADAEVIFNRGIERGIEKSRAERDLPLDFFDTDGQPRWHEIALFCQRNVGRLKRENERDFVNDQVGWTSSREPTQKQGQWLMAIFLKLGGRNQ